MLARRWHERLWTYLVSDREEEKLEHTHVCCADHFRHNALGGETLEAVPGVELLEKHTDGLVACVRELLESGMTLCLHPSFGGKVLVQLINEQVLHEEESRPLANKSYRLAREAC
jgi:hypothetical protein